MPTLPIRAIALLITLSFANSAFAELCKFETETRYSDGSVEVTEFWGACQTTTVVQRPAPVQPRPQYHINELNVYDDAPHTRHRSSGGTGITGRDVVGFIFGAAVGYHLNDGRGYKRHRHRHRGGYLRHRRGGCRIDIHNRVDCR